MSVGNPPHLTKSKYVSGLQCHKKLWLDCHEKTDFQQPVPGSRAYIGTKIGEAAQTLFPDGVLISEKADKHAAALKQTKLAMDNSDVPAIFEAAFEFENIRVRVDILERLPGGAWRIIEIKSGKEVKEPHKNDAAIQYYVLNGCGLDVRSVELGHAKKAYVKEGNEIDWPSYFEREELLDIVIERQTDIESNIMIHKKILQESTPPEIQPNKHKCSAPYECDYWSQCTIGKPLDWVQRLHRFGWKNVVTLDLQGIVSMSDLPDDYKLSAYQKREVEVITSGKKIISPDLGKHLKEAGPPAYYLDFEYTQPAYPYYEGMATAELVAFQWSCHFVESKKELLELTVERCLSLNKTSKPNRHFEYLATGDIDPSRECAIALLDVVGKDEHPIIVYHATAEKSAIKSLAKRVPELQKELLDLLPRLVDLLPIVRSNTCLPEFFRKPVSLSSGTYTIKNTAPAFDDCFDYANLLGVAKGDDAAEAYYRLVSGEFAVGEDRETLREGLLEYCQYDTIAMIVVHKGLLELSNYVE